MNGWKQLKVGARESPLSRAQLAEVEREMRKIFIPVWVKTTGDLDRTTSLRSLGKCDFFTRELDQLVLRGEVDAAIHSAKDLPEPLPEGLEIAALTKGVDSRDVVVLREGEALQEGALIATSSERREEAMRKLQKNLRFVDLRGTIQERLTKLTSEVDGVVVAEAALIRLHLTHLNRIFLPGETTPLQGRLAIVIRKENQELKELFRSIDAQSSLFGAKSSF